MNMIIAQIVLTICTNWTQIGTFHPSGGGSQIVEQAQVTTNTAVRFTHNGESFLITIKSEPGPVVGERKGPVVTDPVFTIPRPYMPTWPNLQGLQTTNLLQPYMPTFPAF